MSISNGRYRCELKEVVDNIHVVISVDEKEYKGLLPLLHSLKKHHTKNLHIHVVNTAQKNATLIEKSIFCGIKPSEDFKVYTEITLIYLLISYKAVKIIVICRFIQ